MQFCGQIRFHFKTQPEHTTKELASVFLNSFSSSPVVDVVQELWHLIQYCFYVCQLVISCWKWPFSKMRERTLLLAQLHYVPVQCRRLLPSCRFVTKPFIYRFPCNRGLLLFHICCWRICETDSRGISNPKWYETRPLPRLWRPLHDARIAVETRWQELRSAATLLLLIIIYRVECQWNENDMPVCCTEEEEQNKIHNVKASSCMSNRFKCNLYCMSISGIAWLHIQDVDVLRVSHLQVDSRMFLMAGELPPSLLVLVLVGFVFWCSSHCQAWATCVSREEIARGRCQPLDQCFFVAAVKLLATGGQGQPVRRRHRRRGNTEQGCGFVFCLSAQALLFNMTRIIIQKRIFSHLFTASRKKVLL